jgi:hypothetical protein
MKVFMMKMSDTSKLINRYQRLWRPHFLQKNHPNKKLIKSFRLTESDFALIEQECRRRSIRFSVFVRKAIMTAALKPEGSNHSVKTGAGHE